MINCSFEDENKTSLRHVVIDSLVLNDNNEVLLVKRTGKLLEGGKWSLIGGFVERDETLKEALEREVLEETGYKVKDITLLTIRDNPNRPKEDRQNISFVFFCTAVEKVGNADWESDAQTWFPLSKLPPKKRVAFDHLENMKLYLKYKRGDLRLPIT